MTASLKTPLAAQLATLTLTVLLMTPAYAAKPEKAVQYQHESALVIAVIDTGADVNHKDLKEFIWTNPGETGLDKFGKQKDSNGIDDDKNGFVDDVHGWNFVENNNNVIDENGHGTHIAGIIKNEFQRHIPVPAAEARLMILKYYSPNIDPNENAKNTVRAIEYATKMNVKIINYSAGGEEFFAQEFEAIKKAQEQNILFIAAAGNNRKNTNLAKYYPANYGLKNIISVAATDKNGNLGAFSNYGNKSVDLAAPGTAVYSTLPNNRHGFMSGTSQATAYVTGVAASILIQESTPKKTQNILSDLVSLGKVSNGLKGKTRFQVAIGEDSAL
ncbi:S8 family peptidase [Pseudobdellovibrio exovorus]|uniref:Peptidase S8/S53 domain-containing protein n=1 Tax=Pseudobdellovibrio exovorus JSS TaxID=1184267 RepID=M4V5L9_9BACT|nr:S8 family peptidase [Pseudobdellovibrio exovorus]AGH94652.1 hypothetical protein A11Q_432 [Pseudobdellovibrio exovorus JSS]